MCLESMATPNILASRVAPRVFGHGVCPLESVSVEQVKTGKACTEKHLEALAS